MTLKAIGRTTNKIIALIALAASIIPLVSVHLNGLKKVDRYLTNDC